MIAGQWWGVVCGRFEPEWHGGGYSRAEAHFEIARMTLEAVGELIELSVGVRRTNAR